MARITHVKKARALYHTKPVLDSDGAPVFTPVTRALADGTTVQKHTKNGRPVTRAAVERDLTRPKPNLTCDYCKGEILPGTPYKYLKLRFAQRNRHEEHPDWQIWEYSTSVAAQAARIQHDMHGLVATTVFEDPESDFDALRDEIASLAQEFLDERQEALDNMPEQLQDGSRAQETVEAVEDWLSEISDATMPDIEEATCTECDGRTVVDCPNCAGASCENCDQSGEVECEECSGTGEDSVSEDWVDEARGVLADAIDSLSL